MRIPFPERVPIERAGIFAISLFAVQSFQGTPFYFSVGCLAFIIIAAFAFNAAGGLTRPSGAYVFFYVLLDVVVGLCYKAYLGEPADSNLRDPHTTILAYDASIAVMLVAVLISRRFSLKTGLLQNVLKDHDLYRSVIGCTLFGIAGPTLIALLGRNGERLATAFAQVNQLLAVAIILGVTYEIRRSGGTRSINTPIVLAGAYVFFVGGVLNFSKQAMFTPLVCWAVPVCALRYRLSLAQVAGAVLTMFLSFYYLVPYCQYARGQYNDDFSFSGQVRSSSKYILHLEDTRQRYKAQMDQAGVEGGMNYYNTPQGFFDRLEFISVDDALIDITDQGKVFGLSPIRLTLLNTIPHVLWPDKPNFLLGNIYAHEIGTMSEDDTTTGISFGATAEAYHMARWFGVLFVAPVIWLMLFMIFDSLCGDVRASPWGLFVLVSFSHIAPEGGLNGLIAFMTFGVFTLTFVAFFAAKIAPICSFVVLGADNRESVPSVPALRPAAGSEEPR